VTLRVGMVGLGVISKYYAAALMQSRELRLAAVFDRDPERCKPYADAGIPVARTLDQLLERPELEAVLVNVPNDLHHAVCSAALEHRLHVCCEKPLATRIEHAEAIAQTAASHERVLFTALHRRYNSNFIPLLKLPRERIAHVRARYFEDIRAHCGDDLWYLDPERCGGGCIADNGPNAIDLVLELVGQASIARARLKRDENGVDLQAVVELSATNGPTASVELDWAYPNGEVKDVTVELDDSTVHTVDLLGGYDAFKSSLYHEYVGVLHDFRDVVSRGAQSGQRGIDLVRLVDDAYRVAVADSPTR
jgi:predicted dehydrogenase